MQDSLELHDDENIFSASFDVVLDGAIGTESDHVFIGVSKKNKGNI